MSVKKPIQKKCNSLGLAAKKIPKNSILKSPCPKLQLESDSDSAGEMDLESDAEMECNHLNNNNNNKFSNGVSTNSDNVITDGSDDEDLSYDGDYDEESATDDESIISCGEDGSEQEDDIDEQESDHLLKETEKAVHAAGISTTGGNEASMDTTAPSKQQQALANVMGSLLKKKKSVVELMNKPKSTSKENERIVRATEKGNKKRKKGQTDNVLEVVGEDGTIEKVKIEPKPSKKMRAAAEETKEIAEPGKRHFPTNSRTDPYCQDPYLDTDVVKEKKLRSLATQGVVQLFNTLEQFRQQGKDMAAAKGGRPGRMAPRQPEVSAITSGGKAGLIDFLMKKGKGGAGLTSRTDRPLFSEVEREPGIMESR